MDNTVQNKSAMATNKIKELKGMYKYQHTNDQGWQVEIFEHVGSQGKSKRIMHL